VKVRRELVYHWYVFKTKEHQLKFLEKLRARVPIVDITISELMIEWSEVEDVMEFESAPLLKRQESGEYQSTAVGVMEE
jgi:hypothetical protein